MQFYYISTTLLSNGKLQIKDVRRKTRKGLCESCIFTPLIKENKLVILSGVVL